MLKRKIEGVSFLILCLVLFSFYSVSKTNGAIAPDTLELIPWSYIEGKVIFNNETVQDKQVAYTEIKLFEIDDVARLAITLSIQSRMLIAQL